MKLRIGVCCDRRFRSTVANMPRYVVKEDALAAVDRGVELRPRLEHDTGARRSTVKPRARHLVLSVAVSYVLVGIVFFAGGYVIGWLLL
jgi:hypothetical protein